MLSFILEGDDDETDKDVDHEEGNDNDEDEVEDGDSRAVVLDWTFPFLVRVDGAVQQAVNKQVQRSKPLSKEASMFPYITLP